MDKYGRMYWYKFVCTNRRIEIIESNQKGMVRRREPIRLAVNN